MPVTSRSLRRNRQRTQSARAAAAIVAGIVGAAGAAWGVAAMFEPFRDNSAKSGEWTEEDVQVPPLIPVVVELPTVGEPAEDIAAGDPAAWRSQSTLLRVAESLNSSTTPMSGGGSGDGDGGGGGGGGGGNNWIIPGPGRSIDLPNFGGDDDDSDDGFNRPDFMVDPGRDGLVLDCVRDAVDAGEASQQSGLVPDKIVEPVVAPECAAEEDEAAASNEGSGESGETSEPAESTEGGDTTVE